MGEHIGPDAFAVADLTADRGGGSFAQYARGVWRHRAGLRAFFRRTGDQFTRFNYLGEWHSRPSFSLEPSGTDVAAMRSIVDDPTVGATFAVLLIVRLSAEGGARGADQPVPARRSDLLSRRNRRRGRRQLRKTSMAQMSRSP
jgi:hypothetical protein